MDVKQNRRHYSSLIYYIFKAPLSIHHDEFSSKSSQDPGLLEALILAAFFINLHAAIAAPNPESIFTTVTPGAEEFKAASKGATPWKAVPYPVDVGKAMTGHSTMPPTTEVIPPSIPVTQMTTSAARTASKFATMRCIPMTPLSGNLNE